MPAAKLFPQGLRHFFRGDQARTNRIVQVVTDIGNHIGESNHLTLESRRQVIRISAKQGAATLGMMKNPVANLPGEVQSGAIVFEVLDDTQTLANMMETVIEEFIQHPLPRVAERSVTKIVPERYRFGKILVELQRSCNCPGDLGNLQGMGQASTVMVSFRREEDLGLVLQTPECLAVENPVAINLEAGPDRAREFAAIPPPGTVTEAGRSCQQGTFTSFYRFTNGHVGFRLWGHQNSKAGTFSIPVIYRLTIV